MQIPDVSLARLLTLTERRYWVLDIAHIILLILSAINFVLAAPVLERGIREVHVDVLDVAKDVPVTTASQKRRSPSDKLSTIAALGGRANAPQNLESSDSDYRLERDLRPYDPRSPMDSNPSPQPSRPVGSTDLDSSHPLPVVLPAPEHDHNDLQFDMDLNDHAPSQPSQEATDGPDSGSHSTDSIPSYPWDNEEARQEAHALPSSSQSHDFNPLLHGNSGIFLNPFNLHSPTAISDPGPDWLYSPTDVVRTGSDPGRPRIPSRTGFYTYSIALPASDSDESIGAYAQSNSDQSTGEHSPPNPGPSTHPPGPLQDDSENVLSELFRGSRFKRRISGSRSVNAAQRELQDTLDSSESMIKGSDENLDAPATTAVPALCPVQRGEWLCARHRLHDIAPKVSHFSEINPGKYAAPLRNGGDYAAAQGLIGQLVAAWILGSTVKKFEPRSLSIAIRKAQDKACKYKSIQIPDVFFSSIACLNRETLLGTGYHISRMQRHKIVAHIILLILSVIKFALTAPVLERGIREVRVDVLDVAKDVPVTTASQKHLNPSDRWSTTAVLADRANALQDLESSDSDYRLEQDLRSHNPRSPMDSNPSPQPSRPVGSTDLDSLSSHPLPVDRPPPEHDENDLQFDMDLNGHAPPQPSQEAIDGPDSGSHSTGSPMYGSSYHSTDSIPPYPSTTRRIGSSQSHDSNPPLHGNSDIFLNPFNLHSPTALSDPGSDWPYSPTGSVRTGSDPGPPRMPPRIGIFTYLPPLPASDSDESIGTYAQSNSVQSTGEHSPPDLGPSAHPLPSSGLLQDDSENVLSELFRGSRFKRRISGSRSVNAVQRELQDTLDSSDSGRRLRALTKFLTPMRPPQYRDVASSLVLKTRPHKVSQATSKAEGNQNPLVLLVRGSAVEVSADRSSGAPIEAPERMSSRAQVPYNV
ncbi:hypothetical protein BGY98DRAFT_932911 [Russula aff. rugulosa BPL654]|nr:hypothetical protein BGY98DRAFT_932911 [Russula aff. rugulosa BPL654]